MKEKQKLFLDVMKEFMKTGALNELVLIGSWTQLFYMEYFNNAPEIPVIRTLDIDFLIPEPRRIKEDINLPDILEKLGFEPLFGLTCGVVKYAHPELEVEFLTPELGRGMPAGHLIGKLHIKAQGIRFLNIYTDHLIELKYNDIKVKVPDPAVYALHKFIVSSRRQNKDKKEKDYEAAISITKLMINNSIHRKRLLQIYESLIPKWKKKILKVLENEKEYSIMETLRNDKSDKFNKTL